VVVVVEGGGEERGARGETITPRVTLTTENPPQLFVFRPLPLRDRSISGTVIERGVREQVPMRIDKAILTRREMSSPVAKPPRF